MFVPTHTHRTCTSISIWWHVLVVGTPQRSLRSLVQWTWMYLLLHFTSLPSLHCCNRAFSSCPPISPLTKHQLGTFKTDSDGMQDIQKHSWRKRYIKKKIPIIYKPNFFQSFPWALRGISERQTWYYSYPKGKEQTWKPVEMHPERISLNSSQTTCTFLREKKKTQNRKNETKQTNPN